MEKPKRANKESGGRHQDSNRTEGGRKSYDEECKKEIERKRQSKKKMIDSPMVINKLEYKQQRRKVKRITKIKTENDTIQKKGTKINKKT